MIRETIEIQCAKCGIVKSQQTMVSYRISSQMDVFIKVLENHGWTFIRDENYELIRVLCGHCAKKEGEPMK